LRRARAALHSNGFYNLKQKRERNQRRQKMGFGTATFKRKS